MFFSSLLPFLLLGFALSSPLPKDKTSKWRSSCNNQMTMQEKNQCQSVNRFQCQVEKKDVCRETLVTRCKTQKKSQGNPVETERCKVRIIPAKDCQKTYPRIICKKCKVMVEANEDEDEEKKSCLDEAEREECEMKELPTVDISPACLSYLLSTDPDSVHHTSNPFGRNTLHLSAQAGKTELVKILVDAGADIEVGDEDEVAPVHLAAAEGRIDIVRLLVQEDPSQLRLTDVVANAAIHFAAEYGHVEVVRFIVEQDRQTLYLETGAGGRNAIIVAARNGQLEVVKYLVGQDKSLTRSITNSLGRTPLLIAARRNYLDIVKFLVESDPDLENHVNFADTNGDTPTDEAQRLGHTEVFNFLVENGGTQS